jgi:hypothetical protein
LTVENSAADSAGALEMRRAVAISVSVVGQTLPVVLQILVQIKQVLAKSL